MSRDEWFRNSKWDAVVEATFEAKLRRARDKAQNLRIQASTLAESNPEVAHLLLDRYFALGDRVDASQAYVDRATAFLTQSNLTGAIDAYEKALETEAVGRHAITQAYLDYPLLIAANRISEKIHRATSVLDTHERRLTFPLEYFKWNAAKAMLERMAGNGRSASKFACAALGAAESKHSGFWYHPEVGLVVQRYANIRRVLEGLRDA